MEVNREIAPSDQMFGKSTDHYFGVGQSALTNVRHALSMAGKEPRRILDFGCGAGRVTRWLRAAYPAAAIEGCDIRENDIRFVAKTFDAKTWKSSTDVDELSPTSTYDLIWVGSVFTHLSKDVSVQLFDRLVSWLDPGGVLVFTSHGRCVVERGPTSGFYGIPDKWQGVVENFSRSEFGYAEYHDTPGYGLSITQLYWWAGLITSRPGVRLISMAEHSWDNHHDVIAVQRVG